ncbi:hypothetical protein VP1G_05028 [Cytospora mali]|uniref:Uncharacterized protein n=1 Tax=Cytospora mali TaxID=578113 RepID=A0A194V169_CYTMA|nr:hypothetical protein VP1G_05028 [Valsa mali var. pyri (nom. inval.)]
MQGDNRHHSKGKGKGKEKALDESFDKPILSEPRDAAIPRIGQSSSSYTRAGYPSWDLYPSSSEGYTYETPGYYNTTPSSAYGGGLSGAYDNTTPAATGSRGSSSRDNYRGGASMASSSYGGAFDGSVTTTPGTMTGVTSSYYADSYASPVYAPSSSAPSTYASSVYAASTTSASTARSSIVPPMYETNNVNHHIAQQPRAQNRYRLPCEFRDLTSCPMEFDGDEEREWREHHETHLRGSFPAKLKCWFCDPFTFDAGHYSNDRSYNFEKRMEHIREHIVYDGKRASDMRPDGYLIKHLYDERIISPQEYDNILVRLNPTKIPPIPGSRSSGDRPSGGRSSRQLEQVWEEPASSSRDRRHHRRHERHQRRENHDSSKRHSKK